MYTLCMCVPMCGEHKTLSPGIFPLLVLPSSSSWHCLRFPLKLLLAIYSEKRGETIKAGSIYQSRSDRPHSSLSPPCPPSELCCSKTGRQGKPQKKSCSLCPLETYRWEKGSGGVEEGGKSVGMCERECKKRVSGFPCLRVHKCKSFSSVHVHVCAGSWVMAAQGFDVLIRHGAHCCRGS